ncbi:hypothetical protein R2F25_00455 [Streptomyces sp. UP1A-1]|nr:hypothetical protein [Streptomyces sp. UP1A-1]
MAEVTAAPAPAGVHRGVHSVTVGERGDGVREILVHRVDDTGAQRGHDRAAVLARLGHQHLLHPAGLEREPGTDSDRSGPCHECAAARSHTAARDSVPAHRHGLDERAHPQVDPVRQYVHLRRVAHGELRQTAALHVRPK